MRSSQTRPARACARSSRETATVAGSHRDAVVERSRAPVSTLAFCTGPAEPILDVASLTTQDGNRWSRKGEPTIYLAGDAGVALAELGRHWDEKPGEMGIWQLDLDLGHAADLRDASVRSDLGVPDDPTWILDRDRCRTFASELRSQGEYDGLIVPSVAFLDDPARWNAVVFVERQGRSPEDLVRAMSMVIRLGPTEGPGRNGHR
jgi:RES domain-containing protein